VTTHGRIEWRDVTTEYRGVLATRNGEELRWLVNRERMRDTVTGETFTRAITTPEKPTPKGDIMLGVVAKLTIKPGTEKEFETVAKELVAKVQAGEPGCKLYVLHKSETPNVYVFMERYVDQAAVEAHRATDYFKALGRKMGEYMEGRPEVMRLTEV
jgi:quinol monooxygenase YgiN